MPISPDSRSKAPVRSLAIFAIIIFAVAVATCLAALPRMHREKSAQRVSTPNAVNTVKMTELLESIANQSDPMSSPYSDEGQAAIIHAKMMEAPPNSLEQSQLLWAYADDLLKSGKSEEGLAAFQKFSTLIRGQNPTIFKKLENQILIKEALCNMRLGEDQNCCANRSVHACLLPIRGSGIHTRTQGSQGAITDLTQVLTSEPKNLMARWLINIAYMTLGEYPGKVPASWLISPSVFKSEYNLKHFDNIAPALNLDFKGQAGGVIMEDFDGDGYLDLMISSWNPHGQLRLMHNNGDGTFTDRTKEAGLIGEIGGLNMIQTDYNNDGKPDVWIERGAWLGKAGHVPSSLLRNNGDGTFTDVTIEAGLLSSHPSQAAVWLDYNNDGWLDLFVGNESRSEDDPNPCELFRNNHDGTFTDVAHECGLDKIAFIKAAISADYNGDGRPDIYLSCQNHPNMLFRNDGPAGADKSWNAPWKFTEVGHEAGVDKQHSSFSCFFFDYDNDGWPDLYVNGFGQNDVSDVAADYLGLPNKAERARLYHNNHNGTFTDITRAAHLYKVNQGMGINFGDLDNDGYLDFFVGTGSPDLSMLIPKRMFRNAGGKFFQEVTTSGDFGHIQKGHAITFGDINNSGLQDVFEVLGGAYTGDVARDVFFKNPGFGNHWIALKLEGVQSNRAAIGARIKIVAATPQGDREVYATVGSGGSFGAKPLRQEIGLGKATAIRSASIFWPATGQTQAVNGLSMDRFYRVREGDSNAIPWLLKSFPLPEARDGIATASGLPAMSRTF